MQNSHLISEDVEPPPTGGRRSDSSGYRVSRSPVAHEFVHGRNSIFKIHPLKKNRLEPRNSLSSCLAPSLMRRAELNGRLSERLGLFEEDDEYPPSALRPIESPRRSFYRHRTTSCVSGPSLRYSVTDLHPRFQVSRKCRHLMLSDERSSARGRYAPRVMYPLAFLPGCPSDVLWFRSVPIGHLAPPGIAAR